MQDIIERRQGNTPVDLAIWLPQLQAWRSAYGGDFCEGALQACVDRLKGLGLDEGSLERAGDTLLARGFEPGMLAGQAGVRSGLPGHAVGPAGNGWMHALEAALSRDPVVVGARQAYLRAEVQALGSVSMNGLQEIRSHGYSAPGGQPPTARRVNARWSKAYQDDMQLAGRLLDDLRQGHLALAFQPVVLLEPGSTGGKGRTLYHECLLRRSVFSVYDNYAVPRAIEALERLGLAARLARSEPEPGSE
jgi:hypothetical protein